MLVIDLQSPIPLEEQIRTRIRERIALGELREGDALPSSRQLARDLTVHWNTVARAYRRLQEEGLLVVGRGRGVVVGSSDRRPARPNSEAKRRLAEKLDSIFADSRLLGLSKGELRAFVLDELRRWSSKERRS